MKLVVKSINADNLTINFDDSTTVKKLKDDIAGKMDSVQSGNLVLVCAGKSLDNDKATLVSLGIDDRSTVYLVYRLAGGLASS